MLFFILIPNIGAGDSIDATLPPKGPPTLVRATIVPPISVASGNHSLVPGFIGSRGPSQLNAFELDKRNKKLPRPSGMLYDNCSFGCFNPLVANVSSSV